MPYGLSLLTFIAAGIWGHRLKPIASLEALPMNKPIDWLIWVAVGYGTFLFWCGVVRFFGGGRYYGDNGRLAQR